MNYTDLALTANRLITDFGQSATLIKNGTGTYDETTGENVFSTTNISVKIVLLDYKEQTTGTVNTTDMVQGSEKKCLMYSSTAPDVDDTLTAGSDTYSITQVFDKNPAGTNIYYEMRVRKNG